MTLTADVLHAATGCIATDSLAAALDDAMTKYDINTQLRRGHFLAQTAWESTLFTRRIEGLNYSAPGMVNAWPRHFYMPPADPQGRQNAMLCVGFPELIANTAYADRMGNGPVGSGDGFRFRGRGFIQLTGREAYEEFALDVGITAVSSPDWLLTDEGAAQSAAWFWHKHGCNDAADGDSVVRVTQLINGGQNGIVGRTALTSKALAALPLF